MLAQPARVTLLLGADPQTLWPVLRRMSVIENTRPVTQPPWAWALSADVRPPAPGTTGPADPGDVGLLSGRRVLVLGAGCVCCSALVEFKARVPALLREQRPQRLIVQLGSGSHPARVIDLLASPEWNALLQIDQVVWIPGRADNDAHPNSGAGMRARMNWLACNVLVEVTPAVRAQELFAVLPPRPFGERPELLSLRNSDESQTLTPQWPALFSAYQPSAKDSSWSLRASGANRCIAEARWSRESCFDRRAALRIFEACIKQDSGLRMCAALSTERAWYEWHYAFGQSSWTDTEYRAQQRLIIESDYSIEHVRRLEMLRDALTAILIR